MTFWYLLSGRVPFVGRTLNDIRLRQTEPLPIEQLKVGNVPARILALLKSMLASDPKDRPQSARELLSESPSLLYKVQRRSTFAPKTIHRGGGRSDGSCRRDRIRSLAVSTRAIFRRDRTIDRGFAFENLSANGEDTYFTVGMQDEITGDLAKLAGMKVIGSQSTRSYLPGKERNLHAIGRDLGVRHLLEGTVSRDNDQMRVALHLVDLRDGAIQWAATYQRPMKDVFALQSEITQAVAARLKTRLSPNETVALNEPPTADLRAYDLYLRAQAIERAGKRYRRIGIAWCSKRFLF